MHRVLLLAVLASQAALLAQIDRSPVPFPGGSNGPLGIPLPVPGGGGRRSGGGQPGQSADNTIHAAGKLRKIDSQSIVVESNDARTLTFRRTSSTKFFKNSKEIKASDLKIGDQVAVDGSQDRQGYLYAGQVYWQGEASDTADTSQPGGTSNAPTPSKPDPDDPGPPVLRRGEPAPKAQTSDAGEASGTPAESAPPPPVPADRYIQQARDIAGKFSSQLPDYACTEYMARYISTTRPANWAAQDVVSAELVYEKGGESYRNLAINSKPVRKEMNQLDGAWSTGEFGSLLEDILSPSTAAEFRFSRQARIAGAYVRVYEFRVDQPHSHWHVQVASQSIDPAYTGSVWVDPESYRVLRIELQARPVPKDFPMDTVESTVDYDRVRISGQEYLLPVHAETLCCERGTANCSNNKIDFRNYHKYDASSNITFDKTSP